MRFVYFFIVLMLLLYCSDLLHDSLTVNIEEYLLVVPLPPPEKKPESENQQADAS